MAFTCPGCGTRDTGKFRDDEPAECQCGWNEHVEDPEPQVCPVCDRLAYDGVCSHCGWKDGG